MHREAAFCLILLDLSTVFSMVVREENSTDVPLEVKSTAYGYKDGDVTQGVGYGHHLHPFYYQGKMRSYNCAKEDDWKPFATQHQEKEHKFGPVKKFDPNLEKLKPKKWRPKSKLVQNRNDLQRFAKLEHSHAKLLRDINAMTDDRAIYNRDKFIIDLSDDPFMEGYAVEEQVQDTATRTPRHRFQRPVVNTLPFQKYKKFTVTNLKPSPMIRFKIPVNYQEKNNKFKRHPYQFIDPYDMQNKYRKGRQAPFTRIEPQFTTLEKFLLLFPRLI